MKRRAGIEPECHRCGNHPLCYPGAMQPEDKTLFEPFRQALIGLPLSHCWQGYGTALFFEFGELRLSKVKRRDGSPGHPEGEFGIMLEFHWRLEGRRRIIAGCDSEEEEWQRRFALIRGKTLKDITLFGRLPELDLEFSNGAHCLSFTMTDGHPRWAIFDNKGEKLQTLYCRDGRLEIEEKMPRRPYKTLPTTAV